MTTEVLTERPRPNDFCFSSLLLLRDEDWKSVHSADAEAVRQAYPDGWQLICFRYRGRQGDYDVLYDGERSIRVRDAVVVPIPEPKYKHGQRVFVPRKQTHGVVRRIAWNWKRKQPYYILDVNGQRSSFWYYDGDLEVGDEWWIYYSGSDGPHNSDTRKPGIGLARLRNEGFVSLRSPPGGGVVVTRTLHWPGGRLLVNTDRRRDTASPGDRL